MYSVVYLYLSIKENLKSHYIFVTVCNYGLICWSFAWPDKSRGVNSLLNYFTDILLPVGRQHERNRSRFTQCLDFSYRLIRYRKEFGSNANLSPSSIIFKGAPGHLLENRVNNWIISNIIWSKSTNTNLFKICIECTYCVCQLPMIFFLEVVYNDRNPRRSLLILKFSLNCS